MKISMHKTLHSFLVALALSTGTFVATAPLQQAMAQARALPDFADLVDQVGPSVVNIRTMEKVRLQQGGRADEDILEFFRRNVPGAPRQAPRQNRPEQEEEQPRGVGSGFILTSDGFIMTNAHVVEGADEVLVTLTDKRELKAKIIGSDKRSDVAVVKIEATGLPAVKVGDVSRLRVGEWVVAIGSPFNLENTVTAGIVSAKQRDTGGGDMQLIQTDVAINPGNSGGPLINMRGEVVGINSQIYSRSGGYMGISFAIPMDEAVRVSDQLRNSGRVSRGLLGVAIGPVSKDVAESIGLGKPIGALIQRVEPGSAAEKGGMEAGDIVTRFEGKTIEKFGDLRQFVGNTKPGTKCTVTVFRRGATKELSIVVTEADADKATAKTPSSKEEKSKPSTAGQSVGLTVSELPDAQKKDLKIKGGVRIDGATEAAARAGLREGDVIIQVGNAEISSVKEFEAALAKHDKAKGLPVTFVRANMAQITIIKPAR